MVSYIVMDIPEYYLKYRYDDWSTVGPSSLLRHRLAFKSMYGVKETSIDLEARCFDDWVFSMTKWCQENIGRIEKTWHFSRYNSCFYFKTLEDTMAFKLRW